MKADNECAQWAAAFLEKVALPLFRQSQGPDVHRPALSLSKKPRRVRTRRCEKSEICFFRRHVRRKKHFSARKCANYPLIIESIKNKTIVLFL